MLTNQQAQQLHDRITRNEPLSPEERTALTTWYSEQDQAELAQLAATGFSESGTERWSAATARLTELSGEVHQISLDNAELRFEISALQQELGKKLTAMPK